MNELPEPLTPADCNLRGLRWMPLDVSRVLDSDLFLISSGTEFKAAFALWAKSWSQVPAGSLPNDERILAGLSGAKEWKRVREVALRGWILCADGRLYHPVIAEKALEAMGKREEHAEREENEQSRQQRLRARRKGMFEQLREHGIVPAYDTKTAELERLIASLPSVTPETQSVTTGDAGDVTGDAPPTANDTHTTGQDSKPKNLGGDTHAAGTPVRASDLSSAMRRHSIEAQPGDPRIIAAAEAGITVATVEAACLQAKQSKPNERIPPYFVIRIAESWTADAKKPPAQARTSPQRPANHHDERAHTIAVLTGRSRDDNPDEPYTIDAAATRIG